MIESTTQLASESPCHSQPAETKSANPKKGACHLSHVTRLNRIEGQVKGVSRMIEEQRYCVDILQQIKSIKSALVSVELAIIDGHLNHCVHDAVKNEGPDRARDQGNFEVLG